MLNINNLLSIELRSKDTNGNEVPTRGTMFKSNRLHSNILMMLYTHSVLLNEHKFFTKEEIMGKLKELLPNKVFGDKYLYGISTFIQAGIVEATSLNNQHLKSKKSLNGYRFNFKTYNYPFNVIKNDDHLLYPLHIPTQGNSDIDEDDEIQNKKYDKKVVHTKEFEEEFN